METYSDYYDIIELIRNNRKMSVEDLCEGIVSVRTYYRYLKSNEQIKFNIFQKLLERLGVEYNELMDYSLYLKKEDPGLNRFIMRVHMNFYVDIVPIYESILKYDNKILLYDLFIKAYIIKYEYSINKISRNQAFDKMNEIINNIPENTDNIYSTSILIIYSEIFNDNRYSLDDLANKILSYDCLMGLMYYIASVDTLLSLFINNNGNYDLVIKLLERYKEVNKYLVVNYFDMKEQLFDAYVALKENKPYEEIIYSYLNSVIILTDGNYIRKLLLEVKEIFKIDPISFLNEYTNNERLQKNNILTK